MRTTQSIISPVHSSRQMHCTSWPHASIEPFVEQLMRLLRSQMPSAPPVAPSGDSAHIASICPMVLAASGPRLMPRPRAQRV